MRGFLSERITIMPIIFSISYNDIKVIGWRLAKFDKANVTIHFMS